MQLLINSIICNVSLSLLELPAHGQHDYAAWPPLPSPARPPGSSPASRVPPRWHAPSGRGGSPPSANMDSDTCREARGERAAPLARKCAHTSSNQGPRCFSTASRSWERSWLDDARSASSFLTCMRKTRLSAVSLATTCNTTPGMPRHAFEWDAHTCMSWLNTRHFYVGFL